MNNASRPRHFNFNNLAACKTVAAKPFALKRELTLLARLSETKEFCIEFLKGAIMNRLRIGISCLSLCVVATFGGMETSTAEAQVREVPVRGLRGIAKVGRDRGGQHTIYYNPRTCRRLGPDLCSFFRAHEYAHVRLNHLGRGTPVRQAESEADIWAAKNSSPRAVRSAVRYFRKGNGGGLRHGTGLARARRVSEAARTAPRTVRVRVNNGKRTLSAQPRRFFAPFGR